ncbi:MAG: glutamyl-tRNA reductase [Planctomycetota bacterium]|nr:MAG: glutamyl-tRNA reductase [Planctomycetota bacterium]
MPWGMIGWSHHHTPLEVREKLAFSKSQVDDALRRFQQLFPRCEAVLLSTCNRVEMYVATDSAEVFPGLDAIGRFLADYHGLSYADIAAQLMRLPDEEAIRHLFMVASALDSMVIGEAQILSQVKQAYDQACQASTARTLMHQLFQRATMVARRVANETEIQKRRVSIPSVAVSEIAAEFFERFDDKHILLIGAGEMGTETLRYLIDAGANCIEIINRSPEKSQELAQQFPATAVPWEELYERLAVADLVISTTGAEQPVVHRDTFRAARTAHHARAVLILDLAVPRDFESSIAELPDVYLYTLDDLRKVCDRNVEARQREWPKATRIVDQELKKFVAESAHRVSGPTIRRLRSQADEIKREELARLLAKLESREVDPEICKEIEVAFDRLVNKLLHPPLKSLRDHADSKHHANLLDALRHLFQLKD